MRISKAHPFTALFLGACFLASQASSWGAAFATGQKADLVIGQSGYTTKLAPIPPTAASLRGPNAVAIDPVTGKVFVSDTANNRVLRYPANALLFNGIPAEAVIGQATLTTGSSNRGNTGPSAVNEGTLSAPKGLTFDAEGRLFVADTGNNRVLRFDNPSVAFSPTAGGVLGQTGFSTFGAATTQSTMRSPSGLAISGSGTLWVADTLNHRVLRFDNASGLANGSSASGVLGQINFTSGGFDRSASRFSGPLAVAISQTGVLWVADTDNDRVLRFKNAATLANGASADSVLGQRDFVSRETLGEKRGVRSPSGLAVNTSGRLWVASAGLNRVTWLDSATNAPVFARFTGVLGQPDFTEVVGTTTRRKLHEPRAVAVLGGRRVFVVDFQNQRVLRFTAQ